MNERKKEILYRIKETNEDHKGNTDLVLKYLGIFLIFVIVGTIFIFFAV